MEGKREGGGGSKKEKARREEGDDNYGVETWRSALLIFFSVHRTDVPSSLKYIL